MELIKSPEELAKADVKVETKPYEGVQQTCNVCGSSLKEGEKVVCRNCSQEK